MKKSGMHAYLCAIAALTVFSEESLAGGPHACCTRDGTCFPVSDCTGCVGGGGICYENQTCDNVDCVAGACCFPDGTCDFLTDDACDEFYQGDNISCSPNPCPQPTACCFPDGHCEELLISTCKANPNNIVFNGVDCDPNPCVQPTGACCYFQCVDGVGENECLTTGGEYGGNGSSCTDPGVCVVGACCDLRFVGNEGCVDGASRTTCEDFGATYSGNNTLCSDGVCPRPCCLNDGACTQATFAECSAQGGNPAGTCVDCPQGFACCFADGSCETLTVPACVDRGGSSDVLGDCSSVFCPPPAGACCFQPPLPIEFCDDDVTAADCTGGFTSFHQGMTCSEIGCGGPLPTGACCHSDGSCDLTLEFDCDPQTAMFQGIGTTCDPNKCPQPARGRVSASQKGSLLMYSKVELRWASGPAGALRQDTILELTNDYPDDVCVQLYFVNGDEPLDPVLDPVTGALLVEGEPGWEWVDCQLCLTPDETTYWSAATGLAAGCQPFTVLDPSTGGGPGRPDPMTPGERHLRGFVYAWAVDQEGHAISWNHLSGAATLINYFNSDAWDYNAWAFQANQTCTLVCDEPDRCEKPREVCTLVAQGDRVGRPGRIRMDGHEYEFGFDMLLMDFFASESRALGSGASVIASDTDLTLHPITADLRQDSIGPVTTKAEFAIWNEDERRFSGTTRCITCWDQTLLSLYGNPNHFLRSNLQTDKGKTRIDGVESIVCDLNCVRDEKNFDHGSLDIDSILDILGIDHVCSYDASMLGVVAKTLAFSGAATARATAGRNLVGMGTQEGWIKWDIVAPPGTAQQGAAGLRHERNFVKSPASTRSADTAAPIDPEQAPSD